MTVHVGRRPVVDTDLAFLVELYAGTRADELAAVPWTDEQKRWFLTQQYEAQDAAYRANYPDASFSVLVMDGQPIGRLYVARLGDSELRIIDIALIQECRNQGIGTSLIEGVVAEGDRDGRFVSLHVEQWNPALRLYERLGFRRAGENDVYVRMERPPQAAD